MRHDSRRYHRRRPPGARAYGMLGALAEGAGAAGAGLESAAGAVGSGLESAAGAVGSGLGSAASSLLGGGGGTAAGATPTLGSVGSYLLNQATGGIGKEATSALGSLGEGIKSLFGSGPQDLAPGLAGPPAPTGPGFVGGFLQGFMHDAPGYVHASGATSAGQGFGKLADMLEQLQAQGGAAIPSLPQQPIVRMAPMAPARGPVVLPSAPAQVATGPIMSLLKPIGSL